MTSHLYLTGFRGTGKSSVAAVLADQLGIPTIDLDRCVESDAGRTIREIFGSAGESEFRRLESQALQRQSSRDAAIIALGGGAILSDDNRRQIKQTGHCVWLTASAETLAQRIAADAASRENRPPLTDLSAIDEVRSLLGARLELYADAADKTVDTENRTIQDIADEIAVWYLGLQPG